MSPPLALQQGKFRALQPQWDEAPTWSGWLRCPECDVGAQSAKGCGQHCFLTGCRWIWMKHSKIWFGEIHLSIYIYVILIDSMCIYRERYVFYDMYFGTNSHFSLVLLLCSAVLRRLARDPSDATTCVGLVGLHECSKPRLMIAGSLWYNSY